MSLHSLRALVALGLIMVTSVITPVILAMGTVDIMLACCLISRVGLGVYR
jgi:hypothetical protein